MAKYKFDWKAAFIPGYGHVKSAINLIRNLKTNGVNWKDFNGGFWIEQPEEDTLNEKAEDVLSDVMSDSRQEYLEDREHTEQREDTAYQRAVTDMRSAGLNPYTVGSSPAPSSVSSVGEHSIMSKLQAVGYILDLQNLNIQNKKLANGVLGTILGYIAGSKLGAAKGVAKK
jgi:hypothetical protein